MKVPIGGHYNLYSAALDTTAKTLTFSNIIGFDLETPMVTVWNTTRSAYLPFGVYASPTVLTYVVGLPVWTITFSQLPAGWANGDTLVILIDIPDVLMNYSVLCYSASKV